METSRLIIDHMSESDKLDYFINIAHDQKVLKTFMCRYEDNIDNFDFSKYITNENIFAIRLKENRKLIGIILIVSSKDDSCEIGYAIGSNYWNNGYVSEATREFIKFCFEIKGFKVVEAGYFIGNNASKRVMEKCGMRYARTALKELNYLGEDKDIVYYSISR